MRYGTNRREFLKAGFGIPAYLPLRKQSQAGWTSKEIWETLTRENWGYQKTGLAEYHDKTGNFGEGRDIAIIDTEFYTDSQIYNAISERSVREITQKPQLLAELPDEFDPYHLNVASTLVEAPGGEAWIYPSTVHEEQGHGTGKTSVAWQAAPNARYHIVKVGGFITETILAESKAQNFIDALQATKNVQQAADDGDGFDVVLANLGISRSLIDPTDNQAKQLANDIANEGAMVIAPSGNGTWPVSPSIAQQAICVASSTVNDEIFSGGSPSNNRNTKPDIAAPGEGVVKLNADTQNPIGGGSQSGYAAPLVAGMVLLLLEHGSPEQVEDALRETAINIEGTELDGDGRVSMMDAYRLLTDNSGGGSRTGADEVGELIEIAYTNSPIEIGETLEVTARVTNPEEESKEWEVQWGELTGDQITLFETQSVSLNPLGKSSVSLDYEEYPEPPYPSPVVLEGEPAGDLRNLGIHAFLRKDGSVLSEYKSAIQKDDTEVTIVDRRSPTRVTNITTNPRDSLSAREELEVSASVVNIGPEAVSTDIGLHFGGRGPLDKTTVSLDPGGQQSTTLTYTPTPHEVGQNDITVLTSDDEISTSIRVVNSGDKRERIEFRDCNTVRVSGDFEEVRVFWVEYTPGIVTNQDSAGSVSGSTVLNISDIVTGNYDKKERAVINRVEAFKSSGSGNPDLERQNPDHDSCHTSARPDMESAITQSFERESVGDETPKDPWYLYNDAGTHEVQDSVSSDGTQSFYTGDAGLGNPSTIAVDLDLSSYETLKHDVYTDRNNPNNGNVKMSLDGAGYNNSRGSDIWTVNNELSQRGFSPYKDEDRWYEDCTTDLSEYSGKHSVVFWVDGDNRVHWDNIQFIQGQSSEGGSPEPAESSSDFRPEIVATNSPIEPAGLLEVTAAIENTGDAEATQEIILKFTHDPWMADAEAEEVDSTTITLEPGDTTTVNFAYDVPEFDSDHSAPIYVVTEDSRTSSEVALNVPGPETPTESSSESAANSEESSSPTWTEADTETSTETSTPTATETDTEASTDIPTETGAATETSTKTPTETVPPTETKEPTETATEWQTEESQTTDKESPE